jgi:hypothetical protein
LAVSSAVFAQTPSQGVFTYHNDLARTGQNLNETILSPSNVNSTGFGKLFADPVDGQVYAQPLYVANVVIPGQGIHNVVYVATENNTVYAFDADTHGAPLWQTSLSINGGTAVPSSDVNCSDLVPVIGVTSTPVIDPSTNTLYVVAKTKEGPATFPSYFQRLHALDIATGAEKFGGPVAIEATVSGTGDGSNGTTITFDPFKQMNRPGLALVNGVVYIAFASHCDHHPYHGWILAYDASHLTQRGVFITTPNGFEGGIWQSGGSVAVDEANNLYVMTGNGTFDANLPNGMDFGDSVLKLIQGGNTLTLVDYFTPFNQAMLNASDADLGSGAPMVLPNQSGAPVPSLLVGAGKEGTIYLLDRNNLGQFCSGCTSDSQIVQSIPGALRANFGTPAFLNNTVYFLAAGDVLKAFALSGGRLSTSPTSQATTRFGFPGATPSVSANGTTGGIVWALQTDAFATNDPAVLHAYDADNVANELYSSNQAAGGRDTLGPAVKFTVPTVVNGKVYVGTATELDVFGVLRDSNAPTITSFAPTSGSVGTSVTIDGTNFTGATAVTFNGVSASFTVNSATAITAAVPAGATTGPISVTNPAGTASSAGSFTVTAVSNPPTIASFAPSSGPVGTSVTISGTNFTEATAVTFNGVSASFTVNSATAITATVPAGATTGPISVTTAGGTATSAGSFTVALQRFTVTVNKASLGIGNGTVTSTSSPDSPTQINCGPTCSATYDSGTTVTLTVALNFLSIFNGWSGCDAVSGTTCTVTMSAARSVTAHFLP